MRGRVKIEGGGIRQIDIEKTTASGFSSSELLAQLRTWKVNHLILAGINASLCVQQTAEEALEYEFTISSAEDIIGDVDYVPDEPFWYENNCTHYTQTPEELFEAIADEK